MYVAERCFLVKIFLSKNETDPTKKGQLQEAPVTKIPEKMGWDTAYNQYLNNHQIKLMESTPYGTKK